MKIYVVGGDTYYTNFIENVELVDSLKDAQVVMFTGGEDVTPSLYHCKKHKTTYCNRERDLYEKKIFQKINPKTQICVGICRGSQFLTVMNGGKLVQNVSNHAIGKTHGITDGSKVYEITSTHHQMMYPFDMPESEYKILYTSYDVWSNCYEGDSINPLIIKNNEPEIVLYERKDLPICLAVQGHPEMIPDSLVSKMINDLIVSLLK